MGQGSTKRWALGRVSSCPAARGIQEARTTQPRALLLVEPCTYPIEEALEEPLECVYAGVDAVLVEVLLQLGQVLFEYAVVVGLEAQQLREPLNEKSCKRSPS